VIGVTRYLSRKRSYRILPDFAQMVVLRL